jgi:small subunit ribosomal protein S3Ae
MAKAATTKKLKSKKWIKLVSPKIFNETELGETLTNQPSNVKDRIIETSLANLIGDFSKQHFKLKFVVDEVKEGVGRTKIKSLYVSRPHIVRRIRKGASKIELVEKVKLKGDTEVITKTILITAFKAHRNQVQMMRKRLKEQIGKMLVKYNLDALVLALCANKIQAELQTKLKKTYPIKYLEIREVTVTKQR